MIPAHAPAAEVCRETLALQDRLRHHVAARWRAESFARTVDEPSPVRRAAALNAVLDSCDLPFIPGELLLGSGLGRLSESEAPGIGAARALVGEMGGRHFGTHADHAAPDYATLVTEGIGGIRARASAALADAPEDRRAFLRSVVDALDGLARHVRRWSAAARDGAHTSPQFRALLSRQSEMLAHIAESPPRTFWEALQLVFLAHSAFQLDDRYAMALGRLDVILIDHYRRDIEAGCLDAAAGQDLLDHLFAKLAHRGDIQNIAVGGLDSCGNDATNELSYLCIEACKRIGQPGGNLTARIHSQTPEAFLRACVECIRTGVGFPSLVNDDVMVPALIDQGYQTQHARDYCFVGCIESYISGRQAPWADSRFNLLRCLDLALRNGVDGLTGERAGPATGEPATWPAFRAAFESQMQAGLDAHMAALDALEIEADAHAGDLASPLMSALTQDCIGRGRDMNDGGALYPACFGVAGMGIGSTADALAAVKQFVYDRHELSLPQLRAMLDANFVGYERERRTLLEEAPKYGNDDEAVDALAVDAAAMFGRRLLTRRTPSGGRYWGLMAANVQNVWAGREVGATPDGRRAREPLSDAASPSFGRDRHGPTAVARSVARLDYTLAPGGNVVNMKFHPTALAGATGVSALAALVRTCFSLGGAQLQFNTTDRTVLMDAMEHPDLHRDLVVRVSGFSAYFVSLDRAVQEDVLARTEHAFAG